MVIASIASFFDDNFVSILNGVALGMLLFVLAIGLSLIFGLLDVLNLAHGSFYMLGTYLGFQLAEKQGLSFIPTALVAFAFGLGLGITLGASLRPMRGRGHLDQALLTLGIVFIVGDLVTIIWGTEAKPAPLPGFLESSTQIFGHYFPKYQLGVMVVGVVLFVLVYVLFERTQLGAILRAAVEDSAMVDALGINVRRVMLAVLMLGSALAAFAGVIGGPLRSIQPGVGDEVLLLALIVVVIGGLGSILGAFAGAVIIGEVQTFGVGLFQRYELQEISSFALFGTMALVLVIRPAGIFTR
jgi:branched-chain amino acid transport system permease protein